MNVLKKWLRLPLWRQSAMAGLLCTIVVMIYALLGIIAYHLYFSFWFSVFLFSFTPVWLVCYGLLFAMRWKWHEMALGVFAALFVMASLYLKSVDDLEYRLLTSLLAACGGVLAVTLGYLTTKLAISIKNDFRHGFLRKVIKNKTLGS